MIEGHEVETQIIGVLLKEPSLAESSDINAEWLVSADYRALFEPFSADYRNDLFQLYARYHAKDGSQMTYSQLSELSQQFVYADQLPELTSTLRGMYIQRQITETATQYLQEPTEENMIGLNEATAQGMAIQSKPDTGELEATAEELNERLITEQLTGIKTFPSLDMLLTGGLYGSMLLTIGARPAVGKTAFSINLCYEVLQHNPVVHIDFFTLEMNKREILNRFVSRDIGVSSSLLRNPIKLDIDVKQFVKESAQKFSQSNLRIFDRANTLGQIIATIRQNASKAKPNEYLAVFDYIGLVSVSGVKEHYLEVSKITRELKVTANELDVPIIELSQLNRGVESRQDKTPVLADLRESGSIEQDSNVVAFLERDDIPGEVEIRKLSVAKNREGSLGTIAFSFDGRSMKFSEVAKR